MEFSKTEMYKCISPIFNTKVGDKYCIREIYDVHLIIASIDSYNDRYYITKNLFRACFERTTIFDHELWMEK